MYDTGFVITEKRPANQKGKWNEMFDIIADSKSRCAVRVQGDMGDDEFFTLYRSIYVAARSNREHHVIVTKRFQKIYVEVIDG